VARFHTPQFGDGSNTLANFKITSDGSDSIIIYDPPLPTSSNQNAIASRPVVTSATIGTGVMLELAFADSESINIHSLKGNVDPDRAQPEDQSPLSNPYHA
jgi:hypothetical protein